MKSVLQNEKGLKDNAKANLNSIKSRYWQKRILKDSDTRRILQKDEVVLEATTGLPLTDF